MWNASFWVLRKFVQEETSHWKHAATKLPNGHVGWSCWLLPWRSYLHCRSRAPGSMLQELVLEKLYATQKSSAEHTVFGKENAFSSFNVSLVPSANRVQCHALWQRKNVKGLSQFSQSRQWRMNKLLPGMVYSCSYKASICTFAHIWAPLWQQNSSVSMYQDTASLLMESSPFPQMRHPSNHFINPCLHE